MNTRNIIGNLPPTATRLAVTGIAALSLLATKNLVDQDRAVASGPAPIESLIPDETIDTNASLAKDIGAPLVDSLTANQSSSKPNGDTCKKDFGKQVVCYWMVRQVQDYPGENRHEWNPCIRIEKAKATQTMQCSITKSNSKTVSAEINGKILAKVGDISAKVGYSITKTNSVTASASATVRRGYSGEIKWAALFGNRKKVIQEYQPCRQSFRRKFEWCEPQKHPKPYNLSYLITEKYQSPVFKTTIRRK